MRISAGEPNMTSHTRALRKRATGVVFIVSSLFRRRTVVHVKRRSTPCSTCLPNSSLQTYHPFFPLPAEFLIIRFILFITSFHPFCWCVCAMSVLPTVGPCCTVDLSTIVESEKSLMCTRGKVACSIICNSQYGPAGNVCDQVRAISRIRSKRGLT
jgi:hypothetical protein